jgi:hypothetical protein
MLAKAQAQEDKPHAIDVRGLPSVAPKLCPYQLLLRQGHIRSMTQED